MHTLDRRTLLLSGMSLGLAGLVARPALARSDLRRGDATIAEGYGRLTPRASANTGEFLLELPDGFEYTVFGATGSALDGAGKTPPAHDGMAALNHRGKIRIVRNHEVHNVPAAGAAIGPSDRTYDPTAGGGTTTLVVDPETRLLERSFVSLSGTLVNCAGGRTPWNSWITCEETTAGSGKSQVYHKDKEQGGGYAKEHGYCFEVPFEADGPTDPVPLRAMGRFVHEAVAVDPSTGIVYLTEDHGTAGLYRFLPDVPGRLAEGGRLQMARAKGRDLLDTRKGQKAGETLGIEWVDIQDPDPADAWKNELAVGDQGRAKGAMTFGRLEGAWYADGCIYLNSTNGGDAGKGQIFRYRPRGEEGGELTLLFESPGAEVLDMPDNVCASPRGGLVVCEDGDGTNYVRGLAPDGRLFDFARNALNDSEFAGATFSPDARTLFVNIQKPGLTLAIWGPWTRGVL